MKNKIILIFLGIILLGSFVSAACFRCRPARPGLNGNCVSFESDCHEKFRVPIDNKYEYYLDCTCGENEEGEWEFLRHDVCKFDGGEGNYFVGKDDKGWYNETHWKAKQRNPNLCIPCLGEEKTLSPREYRIDEKEIAYSSCPVDTILGYGVFRGNYKCSYNSDNLTGFEGHFILRTEHQTNEELKKIITKEYYSSSCNPEKTCPVHKLCPGDANGDGFVDLKDLHLISSKWGSRGGRGSAYNCFEGADLNNDRRVDLKDYNIWLENFLPPLGRVSEDLF